jgi:alginate O-acetyltransferase complex protein AlgI
LVFSSITFLFAFLPLTILLYFIVGKALRNILLLSASLFFYAWGEGIYVLLMLGSIAINYGIGFYLGRVKERRYRKRAVAFGIILNLLLLGIFKYTNWFVDIIAGIIPSLESTDLLVDPIHLPIGISFFTFQALSYIIDVYRNDTKAQNNPFHLGLYIASFPQLIAGPIVRYNQVAQQIVERQHSFTLFASGVERFVFGLAKKVLIANQMGLMADLIFVQDYTQLSPGIAWLGIVCYTLQIYFDFSGYSDMAIGLGRMFGFQFTENFNYPYIARSMQDFWKRWHISLSTWFRDYLYIPLGGNRDGDKKTYRNLFIVFLLCGLWHGASWNFVTWGLIHGTFLALERKTLKHFLNGLTPILRHCYTMFIVINAWVFFRIEDMSDAFDYMGAMYFLNDSADSFNLQISNNLNSLFFFALVLGLLFCLPLVQYLKESTATLLHGRSYSSLIGETAKTCILVSLLYLCVSFLAVNSYNPFIYFRF